MIAAIEAAQNGELVELGTPVEVLSKRERAD